MRAWRSTRSTSSLSDCKRSLRTAPESTWSRRCEPPCRSRPSTMWRCAHAGQCFTVLSGKKFGTAHRHTKNAVSRIAAAFHRVKNNMGFAIPCYVEGRSARAVVLHRLALGANFADHRAHLPHPHPVGHLDLDLAVIPHFGDLADKAAIGDHAVAAAQRLDHLLVPLHPLLLRAKDQKIHDHNNQYQRHELHDHAARVAAEPERAALRECGRNQHCSSGGPFCGAPAFSKMADLAREIARTIATVGPIATLAGVPPSR